MRRIGGLLLLFAIMLSACRRGVSMPEVDYSDDFSSAMEVNLINAIAAARLI